MNQVYDVTTDYEGTDYCGLHSKWNYQAGFVDVSMNNFVNKTLQKLQHKQPRKPQHIPHKYISPIYGQQQQHGQPADTSILLDNK